MSATWSDAPTLKSVYAAVDGIITAQRDEDVAGAALTAARAVNETARHDLYHVVVEASALGATDEELATATGRSPAWVLSTRTTFPSCFRAFG